MKQKRCVQNKGDVNYMERASLVLKRLALNRNTLLKTGKSGQNEMDTLINSALSTPNELYSWSTRSSVWTPREISLFTQLSKWWVIYNLNLSRRHISAVDRLAWYSKCCDSYRPRKRVFYHLIIASGDEYSEQDKSDDSPEKKHWCHLIKYN